MGKKYFVVIIICFTLIWIEDLVESIIKSSEAFFI